MISLTLRQRINDWTFQINLQVLIQMSPSQLSSIQHHSTLLHTHLLELPPIHLNHTCIPTHIHTHREKQADKWMVGWMDWWMDGTNERGALLCMWRKGRMDWQITQGTVLWSFVKIGPVAMEELSFIENCWRRTILFVWSDSLRPINNLSVKQGQFFLGWTSPKLG